MKLIIETIYINPPDNKTLSKLAHKVGFTGTPRFEENASQDGRATADIFGGCLHHYLIKDAIKDGNVLGFSVEYMKTFDRSEKIIEDGYVNKINEGNYTIRIPML